MGVIQIYWNYDVMGVIQIYKNGDVMGKVQIYWNYDVIGVGIFDGLRGMKALGEAMMTETTYSPPLPSFPPSLPSSIHWHNVCPPITSF